MQIKDGLLDEQEYFSKHPVYSTISSDLLGNQNLMIP